MADTKVRSPRATQQIQEDHDRIRELFAEYRRLGDEDLDAKQRTFDRIQDEIAFHTAIEEEIFYPALEGVSGDEARDLVDGAHEEHRIVQELLEELSELLPDAPIFDSKMKVLSENVAAHLDDEEGRLFGLFGRLPAEKQEEVAEELRLRRMDRADEDVDLE